MDSVRAEVVDQAAARAGRYRWVIVALLFAATAINYVDRQMIGVLKPIIVDDLNWTETDYANVIFWFQAAYAIGYIGFGRIIDVIDSTLPPDRSIETRESPAAVALAHRVREGLKAGHSYD